MCGKAVSNEIRWNLIIVLEFPCFSSYYFFLLLCLAQSNTKYVRTVLCDQALHEQEVNPTAVNHTEDYSALPLYARLIEVNFRSSVYKTVTLPNNKKNMVYSIYTFSMTAAK